MMPRGNPAGVTRAGSPSSPGAAVPFIKESEYTVDRSKRLGKGGFGEVFIGLWHAQEIAVKELLNENISEEAKREIEREAAVMVGLRHPNIVQFLGIGARGYAILMEFM